MKQFSLAGLLLMAGLAMAQSQSAAQDANQNSAAVNAAATAATANAVTEKTQPPAAAAPTPAPLEPAGEGAPHTEMLDAPHGEGHDPLLEPKPLPKASLSLIGGVVRKVDQVHNRVTVQPFGSSEKYLVYFDERTRIMSGGRETTVLAIHPGDRVYADTQAVGAQVFAKTIQVHPVTGETHASGQVIEVLGGRVRMQDRSSGEIVRFNITDATKVESQGGPSSAAALHSGALIDVTFTAAGKRNNEAQSITITASPGDSYVFAGTLTHVDLRDGVLAVDNQTDGNNYELYFDPMQEKSVASLMVGTPVTVSANFDGKRYRATSIRVTEP